MTESEVRKLLRQMKEQDSQTAFRDFYDMTYDRLFRIAYYYVKQEEWSQEIVLETTGHTARCKKHRGLLFHSSQKRFTQLSGEGIKVHHCPFFLLARTAGTKLFTRGDINYRRIIRSLRQGA